MAAIAVKHFHARLRADDSQRQRLNRVLALALDDRLEAAVGRDGLADRGEICIREIHALVRLDLSESDDRLAARLALAIADAIATGAGQPSAGLVRYLSRTHALADFAASTLGGDFSRAWAWRQLGIGQAEFAASAADAARQVLAALARHPEQATAVLATVAAETALFERLLRHGPLAQWRGLARRVIEAMAGDADTLLEPMPEPVRPGVAEAAAQWLKRSAIARAALASSRRAPFAEPALLAVFVLAEAEPALLQSPAPPARARIQAIASAFAPPVRRQAAPAQTPTLAAENPQPADAAEPSAADLSPAGDKRPQADASASHELAQTAETLSPLAEPAGQKLGAAETRQSADAPTVSKVLPNGDAANAQAIDESPLPPRTHSLPDGRRQAHTAFGGLLFLIHLAKQIGLAARIVQTPGLERRDPRWCLLQIALALVPTTPADPVALAFAGWLPDSEPPDEPPPDEAEQAALDGLRGNLLEALCERLAQTGLAADGLLDFVCHRKADIIADPGWLEAHFALDGVSTEIRAAGLDLDPGWVPWLGLVIRFVYV